MLSQGVAIQRRHTPFCESEEAKCFLEDECLNMGVKVRLYTSVIGVRCEHGRIQEVITHSKSGLEAWRANVFIDATGDGDLGALSGCEFEMGKQGKLQPLSLTGLITGIHIEDVTCMDNSVIHQNGSPKKDFWKNCTELDVTRPIQILAFIVFGTTFLFFRSIMNTVFAQVMHRHLQMQLSMPDTKSRMLFQNFEIMEEYGKIFGFYLPHRKLVSVRGAESEVLLVFL